MDADSANAAFKNFYGDSNYEGYISKFISKRIFEYSINSYANIILRQFALEIFDRVSEIIIYELLIDKIELKGKSIRDIAKVLDKFKDAYRRTEVRITEDFYFLSDTPFVKLLAILVRLGVKRNHLSNYLEVIYDKFLKKQIEYIETLSEEKFIELLGCFAMSEDSIRENGKIYYDGIVYQMLFNKDQDGYTIVKGVIPLNDKKRFRRDEIPEINLDEIVERGLHYIN